MAETPIFWLGGKPGKPEAAKKTPELDVQFAEKIGDACAARGFEVRDFVASAGAFGSWLVHLNKEDRAHRLVWNGKEHQLAFERALEHGGWEGRSIGEVPSEDVDGFVAAIESIFDADRQEKA